QLPPRHLPSCLTAHPPPPTATLFPYTTLFRSEIGARDQQFFRRGAENLERALQLELVHRLFDREGGADHDRRVHVVPLGVSGRRSEEHTSELQSRVDLVCRLLLEKKNKYMDGS